MIYWASGIVSICGIIFEVIFGALGSYILGDGVKQYTLTISLFLTGMGIGASLSEKVTTNLIISFVWIEFMVAIFGGFSSFTMFGVTAFLPAGTESLYLYMITLIVGGLTGVELPVLIRKANNLGVTLNKSTARVLFSDYAGGLIGGLLFVFLLRPELGMVKSAFFVGCINLSVALYILWLFRDEIQDWKKHGLVGVIIGIFLVAGLFLGEKIAFSFEQQMYKDPIIYMEDTQYQKIVLTKEKGDTRLYLDGGLQFSSTDEYRYHEVLVHPVMSQVESHDRILVLGGGDGLAIRELLKYEDTGEITLVDLDPAVVELASKSYHLVKLNEGALQDEKVNIKHQDAFEYLEGSNQFYDVILVDLPDPNNESLNKLYTKEFYSLVRNHLKPDGAMMVQSTSPVFAPQVYWTISETISDTGLNVENFHVDVPSFGNWGFVMASCENIDVNQLEVKAETRFLTTDMLLSLTEFGKDEDSEIVENGHVIPIEPNTLINPHLLEKYEEAWINY
ncbi:polyamine aminopropyltransferase [Salinibacillus kushneri]|nr:polyamine aminopropyltransferase [Salinibacillus kushneri]